MPIDFRQQIKNRISAIKTSIPIVSRNAGINQQTLYNYLSKKKNRTALSCDTLTIVLGVLDEMETEFERSNESLKG